MCKLLRLKQEQRMGQRVYGIFVHLLLFIINMIALNISM